jgi:hypothetical protein
MKKGIIFSILLFTASIVPFIIINYEGFLKTYFFHFNRVSEQHSVIYYGDALTKLFFNSEPFSKFSLVLLVLIECAILTWYYLYLKNDYQTLCHIIFLTVFFFILVNKVFSACYIIWLTPFLALFLINSTREILLFYLLEIFIYIETPLLYRVVYGLEKPYTVLENSVPTLSFLFYTVKVAVFFIVFLIILRQIRKNQREPGDLNLSDT